MWERTLVNTDRGAFEVFVRGEGDPLCVTHLYSEFNETGDQFANILTAHRKVFLVNLKDAGQSATANQPEELDMEETVEDLDAIRTGLELNTWDFAGHSTGGMLGLMYAVRHPESLSSLIVVGTAASKNYAEQPDCIYHPDHPMFGRMQELQRLQLQPDISVEQKRAYGQELTKLSLYQPDHYTRYFSGDIKKKVVQTRLNHFSRVDFPSFHLTPELPNVRIPTLVMCGRHDVQCPLRCSVEIHDLLPSSKLVVFENSNHYPFLEEPSNFIAQTADFLGGD